MVMIGRLHTGLRVAGPKAVETRVNRAEGQKRCGLAPDLGPPRVHDCEVSLGWRDRAYSSPWKASVRACRACKNMQE